MIPLAVPCLVGNEASYLQECVESNFVSSAGPFVTRFEHMVRDASAAASAVATASGTAGLHTALTAVGVKHNDLVILPSYTFIASANAISQCGASPWLFDISEADWALDPALLERELRTKTRRRNAELIHRPSGRRVAAMVPVYTFGLPADMEAIVEIARSYDVPVVADAAAAIGATYLGRQVGELGADLTVFSFNGNKTVTAGGGGAIVGNDIALLNLVKHLSTTARIGTDYTHDMPGFNYRMTNIQAAVGCAQMERVNDLVSKKRRIQAVYIEELGTIPGIELFPRPEGRESACWFSGIYLGPDIELSLKDAVTKLNDRGIGCRTFWKPMHQQPPYADCPLTKQTVSDAIWNRILTLPCSADLSGDDQSRVIQAVRSILEP